jgi:type II secretory pathway pseudopilin PulG
MKFLKIKKRDNQEGITIIELLITMPIATMIIIVLFSVLFSQYTSILAESARSNLRANGQTILINLQDELLFTISYGEQLNSDLSDAYSPSGGWVHNSNPQTLIINEVALDSTRRDDDRNIVRERTNDCATSSISSNSVALNNIIYHVKDNPGQQYDQLVKRTVTPTYSLCSIDRNTGQPCAPTTSTCLGNAKKTSCPAGQEGNNNCVVADSILSEKVIDFDINYFTKNNVLTTSPSSAEKVEIILTLGDKVYGKEITTEVRHTIRKIN